jgi:glyoxylate carboligase
VKIILVVAELNAVFASIATVYALSILKSAVFACYDHRMSAMVVRMNENASCGKSIIEPGRLMQIIGHYYMNRDPGSIFQKKNCRKWINI